MNIKEANKILQGNLGSERWYFEERGAKIWFMEKLFQTYNRVFPLTFSDGNCGEVYDFHLYRALNFVRRRRQFENRKMFDVKRAIYSGKTDDLEGKGGYKEKQISSW